MSPESKHNTLCFTVLFIVDIKLLACMCVPTQLCTFVKTEDKAAEEEEQYWAVRTLRLRLLPLVGCFRLLPLNHAAAYDAVKTPQVEEGDTPKQPHCDNLCEQSKL